MNVLITKETCAAAKGYISMEEKACLSTCDAGENLRPDEEGTHCECTPDAAYVDSEDRCLIPNDNNKECKRRTEKNGVLTCITN